MKIIISEDQQKVLLESKQIESAQNLVDMAVDDYVEGCSKRKAFRNLELALCKGFKNGTTKLKVLDVKKIHDHYNVKLSIHTDQEWFQRVDFEDFEISLQIRVANIIGTHKYGFDIEDIELNDGEETITESLTRKEKLKKFLTNKMGFDFSNNIQQVTSTYDIPMSFDECVYGETINRYLNFWGPMYIFELDGYNYLYQDRGEFEWFMSDDENCTDYVDDEIPEKLGIAEMGLRFSDIIDKFFEEGEDMINESREMSTKLRRRFSELEKIGDIIEYQTEIQDPCDFEDETDYSDFCIGQGLSFYYNDEEDEDYEYPSDEMVEVRDEVEEYLEEKYHDYLVDIYNDLVENCN